MKVNMSKPAVMGEPKGGNPAKIANAIGKASVKISNLRTLYSRVSGKPIMRPGIGKTTKMMPKLKQTPRTGTSILPLKTGAAGRAAGLSTKNPTP